jgi:hypothetical protein
MVLGLLTVVSCDFNLHTVLYRGHQSLLAGALNGQDVAGNVAQGGLLAGGFNQAESVRGLDCVNASDHGAPLKAVGCAVVAVAASVANHNTTVLVVCVRGAAGPCHGGQCYQIDSDKCFFHGDSFVV